MTADVEIWHALHADCPSEGCGGCVNLAIDVDTADMARLQAAAELMRLPIDEFIHLALVEVLR